MLRTIQGVTELTEILKSVNCPQIIRSDEWWMEELLFKPGKPRTDLLVWIVGVVSKALSYTPCSGPDLDLTISSVASNSCRLPESDEAIHQLLCVSGFCQQADLSFVQGLALPEEQIKVWERLIRCLPSLEKTNLNSELAFGLCTVKEASSSYRDAFTVTAEILPADIKSECERYYKQNPAPRPPAGEKSTQRQTAYDVQFAESFIEEANRLKEAAKRFTSVYNDDLRVCLPKGVSSVRPMDIGDEPATIATKLKSWKEGIDCLQELHRQSSLDTTLDKTKALLARAINDRDFPPFKDLCSQK